MIKGIIFDMGYTLLRFTGDWKIVTQEGAEAMAMWYFKKKRIRLDASALIEAFFNERIAGFEKASRTQTEVLAQECLHNALESIDAPASTRRLVEAAIKIYFEPEEAAWQSYPDAVDTVKLLRDQGYRLGLYSNATDDAFVQRLINRSRLRPGLSPVFSSAKWGWRKPKPEPFELIAGRWRLSPQEIVVVGDTLNADILGAQNAGMHSILMTIDEADSNDDNRHIQPTAIADSLSDLSQIIAQL